MYLLTTFTAGNKKQKKLKKPGQGMGKKPSALMQALTNAMRTPTPPPKTPTPPPPPTPPPGNIYKKKIGSMYYRRYWNRAVNNVYNFP